LDRARCDNGLVGKAGVNLVICADDPVRNGGTQIAANEIVRTSPTPATSGLERRTARPSFHGCLFGSNGPRGGEDVVDIRMRQRCAKVHRTAVSTSKRILGVREYFAKTASSNLNWANPL
jgi:hypothetical protein